MSGSPPIDTATLAFRRVLAEATSGEQARVDALVALAQRVLFAASWPAPSQQARTLTNSDGETALPLFTGLDALEETATRFGWRGPDGSLPYRELSAGEALRYALERGVHFVVLDMGADHSVEFAREELEPVLLLQAGRHGAGAHALASEPHAAILDRVRRSNLPPRPAGWMAPAADGGRRVAVDAALAAAPSLPDHAQRAAAPSEADHAQRVAAPSTMDHAQRAVAPSPAGRAASVPLVVPSASGTPATRVSTQGLAAQSAVPAAAGHGRLPPRRPASVPLTGAARPPSVHPPAALSGSNVARPRPPSSQGFPAVAARPQPLAAGGAAAIPPQPPRQITREVPAAKAPPPPPPQPPRQITREVPSHRPEAGSSNLGATRDDLRKSKSLGAPKLALSDTLRDGIASALRSFPEVEWACVASDSSDIPLIGVRVDPSFLNRVADITDAILDSAEKQGTTLQVLLLNNVELVKSAHRHGQAFYPWKK